MPFPTYLEDLLRPGAYDDQVDAVQLIQTHISYVLIAGAYAYKIKKPLNLGFLDYTTLERRHVMCEEEVRLNRRLCDDVYIGVVPITRSAEGTARISGDGTPIEYAVQMRRVPDELSMPHLLGANTLTRRHLQLLAEKMASFHRRTASDDRISAFGRVAAIRQNWNENFRQVAPYVGRTLTTHRLQAMREYVNRFLESHDALLEERARTGRVRDCHGDLRCDSVVFGFDASVCVMDCIEFNERLRCGDVASDVAFLAMDLDFRGHRREADEFMSLYQEALGADETLPVVLNFYRAYRAFVRGKVDSMLSDEPEVAPAQRAEATSRALRYFELAQTYAEDAFPPALIVMVGLSGTGKSYIARALAGRIGAVLLSTDAVRQEAHSAHPEPAPYDLGAYSSGQRDAVYAEMFARARRHLALKRSVVLDATFLARRHRAAAKEIGADAGLPTLVVQVVAPEDVARERLAERGAGGVSDARWDTYVAQRERSEPLDDIDAAQLVTLDSTLPLDEIVGQALSVLEMVASSRRSSGFPGA